MYDRSMFKFIYNIYNDNNNVKMCALRAAEQTVGSGSREKCDKKQMAVLRMLGS